LSAFFLSLVVIFLAELGDKSQLMAMTFATRFRALPVLIGITVATAVVHLASVLLGAALGAALPTGPISILAGLAFLGFAAWTLHGDELTEEERASAGRATPTGSGPSSNSEQVVCYRHPAPKRIMRKRVLLVRGALCGRTRDEAGVHSGHSAFLRIGRAQPEGWNAAGARSASTVERRSRGTHP
jgi:putative Ca2+/H+ antiporter (TMEM165/GDT1 family)